MGLEGCRERGGAPTNAMQQRKRGAVQAGVVGTRGPDVRTYYRVLELDASESGAADRLGGIFESVFRGLAMRVMVDPQAPPEENSASAELVESMRQLPNLHFAAEQ